MSVARSTANADALREWNAAVERMVRAGEIIVGPRIEDRTFAGRTHEYLFQAVDGIRVYGSGLSRQSDADGTTVSLFGNLHGRIDADTAPALSPTETAARLEQSLGGRFDASQHPAALVLLPLPGGDLALTYRIGASDARYYFVDAHSGGILHVQDAFNRQASLGGGFTFGGKWRELSTTRADRHFP